MMVFSTVSHLLLSDNRRVTDHEVPVDVVNVPISGPPSPRSNIDTAEGDPGRSLDTPGSTETPDTPKVSKEEQWKAQIRKGPTYVARMKSINADQEYIFVCRCRVCVFNGIQRASVSTFSKGIYQMYKPREERPTEGTHIAIDRHGFVSYNHPFPSTALARRKRSYVRSHLRETTNLEASDPDFPVCARTIRRVRPNKTARTDPAVAQVPTVVQQPTVRRSLTEQITNALENINRLQTMMAVATSNASKEALQKTIELQLQELSNLK